MIHVFILSFNGIDYLNSWFKPDNFKKDIQFHIIDNGNQKIPKELENILLHKCKENIFCAGGWNLALDIGFNYLHQEKVLVVEDDINFNEDVIQKCYDLCNSKSIATGRNDQFGYSFFAMHKDTYKLVGRFDENCLYVTCEDNDYKHRCAIHGVAHVSANYYLHDLHLTSSVMSYKYGNKEYIESKWDNYTAVVPRTTEKFRPEYWKCFEKIHNDFMSVVEYNRFTSYENI